MVKVVRVVKVVKLIKMVKVVTAFKVVNIVGVVKMIAFSYFSSTRLSACQRPNPQAPKSTFIKKLWFVFCTKGGFVVSEFRSSRASFGHSWLWLLFSINVGLFLVSLESWLVFLVYGFIENNLLGYANSYLTEMELDLIGFNNISHRLTKIDLKRPFIGM